MTESPILRRIQTECTDENTRLWRNNTGTAWQGQVSHNRDGSITIRNPRIVHFGLCPGSSDLIGLVSTLITPAHVGTRIARFAAPEVKTGPKARRTSEQVAFTNQVREMGGLSGFCWSVETALDLLSANAYSSAIE